MGPGSQFLASLIEKLSIVPTFPRNHSWMPPLLKQKLAAYATLDLLMFCMCVGGIPLVYLSTFNFTLTSAALPF